MDQCTNTLDKLSVRDTIWPKTCAKVVRDLAARIRHSVDLSAHSQHDLAQIAVSDLTPPAEEAGSSHFPVPVPDPGWRVNTQSQDFFSNSFDQGPEMIDLFRGFDIPFWLGDDQYADVTNDYSFQ